MVSFKLDVQKRPAMGTDSDEIIKKKHKTAASTAQPKPTTIPTRPPKNPTEVSSNWKQLSQQLGQSSLKNNKHKKKMGGVKHSSNEKVARADDKYVYTVSTCLNVHCLMCIRVNYCSSTNVVI